MAEQQHPQAHTNNTSVHVPPADNATDNRGCFDFLRKKEQKNEEEDLVMTDLDTAKDEKHTLLQELQRTHSHSSSSSEEEVEEGGERKKKKKKGLKEAAKEKLSGHAEGTETEHNNNVCVPMEKIDNEETVVDHPHEQSKGFIEKIKEKLPGQQHKKKTAEEQEDIPPTCEQIPAESDTNKEKKGIIDKIKEKLPGGHHKSNENQIKED